MIDIPFINIAIPLIVIWIVYRVTILMKKKDRNILREVFINLFFVYFLMVVYFTFFKHGRLIMTLDGERYANFIPLVETVKMFTDSRMGIKNALFNVVGNILLFVPLGVGIPLFFRNKNKLLNIAAYGMLFSILIEGFQYLTWSNITDVDDVIFNTFGAVVGFFIFNILINIIEKTKLKSISKSLSVNYEGSLVIRSLKPLLPMILIITSIIFTSIYLKTASGNLSDKEIARSIFTFNSEGNYVCIEGLDQYKLFLSKYDRYLDLSTSKKVLGNRWIQGSSIGQLDLSKGEYSYEITTIYRQEDNKISPIIYGKNLHAAKVEIEFMGKGYSKELPEDDYFIVTIDEFKNVNEYSDINNMGKGSASKDLSVKFVEKDGSECKHIILENN